MPATFTIQLQQLRFYSAHGLYAEEAQAGNEFEINLSLVVKAPEEKITSLSETINYAAVYRLVKDIFSVRKALLETIAMEIAEELKKQFPLLLEISLQIIKLHPPIRTFVGSVSVTYHKKFED